MDAGELGARVRRGSPDDVHVLTASLDAAPEGAARLLDEDERTRAERFVFERDRRRFLLTHAWTRNVLAACVGGAPESLEFERGPHGKPRLLKAARDIRFNLSHSGTRAVLAIVVGREVGVDIEAHRAVEVEKLAGRFFSGGEVDALRAVEPGERVSAFFRCWTRKEAFIKGLGRGLSFPLDGFEVAIEHGPTTPDTQLLRSCVAWPEAMASWQVLNLPLDSAGYSAALAVESQAPRIVRWGVNLSTNDFQCERTVS